MSSLKTSNYHNLQGIDGKNLEYLIKNGPSLVRYHANWCGHCIGMLDEWEKLIKNLSNKNIVIVDVEAGALPQISDKYKQGVDGFPTIVSYYNGDNRISYEGSRDANSILEWINQNHTISISKKDGKILKKKTNKTKSRNHHKRKSIKARKSIRSKRTKKSNKSRKSRK